MPLPLPLVHRPLHWSPMPPRCLILHTAHYTLCTMWGNPFTYPSPLTNPIHRGKTRASRGTSTDRARDQALFCFSMVSPCLTSLDSEWHGMAWGSWSARPHAHSAAHRTESGHDRRDRLLAEAYPGHSKRTYKLNSRSYGHALFGVYVYIITSSSIYAWISLMQKPSMPSNILCMLHTLFNYNSERARDTLCERLKAIFHLYHAYLKRMRRRRRVIQTTIHEVADQNPVACTKLPADWPPTDRQLLIMIFRISPFQNIVLLSTSRLC
ncbi:hypothetical protein B0J11DRAFT_115994 [Dendryphion nanum]|uniref:Uncharacterized protein n=1 Tax=Dendryphion nanum TaxID=256645 RepID=A0A9P9IDM9_9PLEO|nr:hypothetical protein B0J11DRAFT_115994 [Dendryphion nanum]